MPSRLDEVVIRLDMPANYILRLDDIAPNMHWRNFGYVRDACQAVGVKPLLGVIPENQDPQLLQYPRCQFPFFREMRKLQSDGWEIAQHGFQHRYVTQSGGMLNLASRSEFAGLPLEFQRQKLREGKEILKRHGINTRTFMAPSHSFDRDTLTALVDLGFASVTDGLSLLPYREYDLLFVPQLFGRPRLMPFGLFTFCLHLNSMTSEGTQAVVSFIRQHARKFIAFSESGRYASENGLHRRVGQAIDSALRFRVRAKRRSLAGRQAATGRVIPQQPQDGFDQRSGR